MARVGQLSSGACPPWKQGGPGGQELSGTSRDEARPRAAVNLERTLGASGCGSWPFGSGRESGVVSVWRGFADFSSMEVSRSEVNVALTTMRVQVALDFLVQYWPKRSSLRRNAE